MPDISYKFSVKSISLLLLTLLVLSCSDDDNDDPVITLKANAGPDQMVKPKEMVTLDGSASNGPAGFTYSWTFTGTVPENEINFQNTSSANPTFTPPTAGQYTFSLTIAFEGQTDQDVVVVEATGALTIGGTLDGDLSLKNVENNPELADYLIDSDLIVPEGITLTIEENVRIEVADNLGIQVNGTITNGNGESFFEDVELVSETGWKGILVDGGLVDLQGVIIEKAGTSPWDGQTETGAIHFTGDPSEITNFRLNEFRGSVSYDLLVDAEVSGFQTVRSNILSFNIPIKARMSFLDTFFRSEPNILPPDFQFIHLMPKGLETADVFPAGRFFDFYHKAYYFDGSFRAGSPVSSAAGVTYYIKENSSLLFEKTTTLGRNSGESSTITGFNGAAWNGIAALDGVSLKINNTVISNAGAAPVVGGTVQSPVKTAVYQQGRGTGWLWGVTITDSEGFGLYIDSPDDAFNTFEVMESTFRNTKEAAIRINAIAMTNIKAGNFFELDDNIPGCLVEQDGSPSEFFLRALEGSFYLIDADLTFNTTGSFTLDPGVHLKFKSGRSFRYPPSLGSVLRVDGETEKPVIMEGENDTPGAWGGMILEGDFDINYLQIKNGGEFMQPGANNSSNVYFNNVGIGVFQIFNNSTISGSAGYGVVMSNNAINFDFEDPAKNNTFSGNALGTVIKE